MGDIICLEAGRDFLSVLGPFEALAVLEPSGDLIDLWTGDLIDLGGDFMDLGGESICLGDTMPLVPLPTSY